MCPRGVTKKSSAPQLDQRQRWREREYLRKQEEKGEREIVCWQGLNCSVEQLFLAELPALSALKEMGYY